ncbi:LacI family DNA-binding transcriptional regulator [Naumannella halotolerans]|uniref:DNA-binding LacI/PurR family transcriptional regulator n=1 Tax=Naumannella halotolerans TaxID=993414 RepID=A0A4R7J0P8_9ACTN|nr:LacI family DNA-binding transcriptional regulator [Naumannella halotolerans]TDT29809.1 DNA-binding LacI/PurR family transcriptional regulator [Naumannella halotolerans]
MQAVSIAEVAKRAGVSTATVSRALSGRGTVSPARKQAVLDAAAALGYVVASNASSLASGRTRNVGVVIPFLDRWYFGQVLEGAQLTLLEAGYDVTLYNLAGGTRARAQVFEQFLLRQRVDAVLAVALELTPHEIARLHQVGKPLVCIGGVIPGVPSLGIDDLAVSELATDHLTGLGHTTIGFIGGKPEVDSDFQLPVQRFDGYRRSLQRAGIEFDPALALYGDFTLDGGYTAAKQLLGAPGRHRPTAISAASDEMAIGAILAARDLGLSVPGDVSVAGVDDYVHSEFFGLTTVAQFPYRQGVEAARVIIDQLDHDRQSPSAISLPHELVVRSSTARPRPHSSPDKTSPGG